MKTFDLDNLAILWVASEGNIPQQQEIEEKLRPMIEANKRFSRESLFELNCISKRVIGISFIPTSDAYKKYGASVTISKFLEIEGIRKNYESKTDTFGYMKASGFISVPNEDIEISFQSNEILSISHI